MDNGRHGFFQPTSFFPRSSVSVPPMVPPLYPPTSRVPATLESDLRDLPSNSTATLFEIPIPKSESLRIPTFDAYLHENYFARLSKGEAKLNEALHARNQKITPSGEQYQAVSCMVGEVKQALETIVALGLNKGVKMEEFRMVGSFKNDTMLNKSNVADMVLVCSALPKHDDLVKMAESVVDMIKDRLPVYTFTVIKEPFGCSIRSSAAAVRLLPALADDSVEVEEGVHMQKGFFIRNKLALRHAYWFEDNVKNPSIRMLIRLVKDIRRRSKGMKSLNAWTVMLLSHYCVTYTSNGEPLPLSHAFRRFFSLISAGILLHTSISLTDPCSPDLRINRGYQLNEADDICRCSQFVLRLLIHEKYDRLLGKKNVHRDLCGENEYEKNKLNIAPVREAYNCDTIVNTPDTDFCTDLYRYGDSQPPFEETPPTSPKVLEPVQKKPRPLPNHNEFKEFYKSIQVITSSRPAVNKSTAKSMVRNALFNP
ncbi:unnamed protein product [Bursaphelenchus xylophilus]|uniref:(pine wood nematode) hypothetical protein n=1 Tax=Bursaphelenchus xylophilus TaxID=6326 RepID=A0A1I7RSG4_BURXY|nr:unnamed protein product [Bursaphelenchus xylophilus]CAG9122969.1 unnamed protein product [Bursaphelenchus xylophilus]